MSLILGIVGLWPIFGVVAGIPALYLARRAKDDIALSGGDERGWRMAQTARVLGWVSVAEAAVPAIVLILFVVACSSAEGNCA